MTLIETIGHAEIEINFKANSNNIAPTETEMQRIEELIYNGIKSGFIRAEVETRQKHTKIYWGTWLVIDEM